MRVSWIAGSLLGLAALSAPAVGQAGQRAPGFNASRWYNSPPLTRENLAGKAVRIEVFRTW
jgi:hypothetical protein